MICFLPLSNSIDDVRYETESAGWTKGDGHKQRQHNKQLHFGLLEIGFLLLSFIQAMDINT